MLEPVTIVLVAVSLGISTAGVWYSIRFANRIRLLDVPNERSSHAVPTPRMGGGPMVAAATIAFGGWALFAGGGVLLGKGLSYTFLFALSMFALGFVDDLRNLSPLFRFVVQILSASLFFWGLAPFFPVIPLGRWMVPGTVWILVGAVWSIWMLNLYNFMDGIDGLAGGEAAVASSFFFLVFAWFGEPGWAVANLSVAAASMGFLVYNWPPARTFMGNGGSSFLGAFYGMQCVVAHLTTPVPFLVLVLPFANFILDTTYTLFRRVFRGEKWYLAHRSHLYQRMTNLGMSHRKVTVIELIVVTASCGVSAVSISASNSVRTALTLAVAAGISSGGTWIAWRERGIKAKED